jgi:hypothetical protein
MFLNTADYSFTPQRLIPTLSVSLGHNSVGYGEHNSRSNDAVIRVYDDADNMIETHERADDFKE